MVSPATSVVYLGLELDSTTLKVSLPSGKLSRLRSLLLTFSLKDKCTKKELEVLAGHLTHASMVVRGGRTFSRRVINMVKYMSDEVKICVIPDWLKEDIQWWISMEIKRTFSGLSYDVFFIFLFTLFLVHFFI